METTVMRARFVDSSDCMIYEKYKNMYGSLTLDGCAYWTNTVSTAFTTSLIVSYEMLDEHIVELKTLNSRYIFELIHCTFNPTGINEVDKEIIETYQEISELEFTQFACQLDAGFLDGLHSIVTLDKPMTIDEARLYIIKHSVRDDNENAKISILLYGIDNLPVI